MAIRCQSLSDSLIQLAIGTSSWILHNPFFLHFASWNKSQLAICGDAKNSPVCKANQHWELCYVTVRSVLVKHGPQRIVQCFYVNHAVCCGVSSHSSIHSVPLFVCLIHPQLLTNENGLPLSLHGHLKVHHMCSKLEKSTKYTHIFRYEALFSAQLIDHQWCLHNLSDYFLSEAWLMMESQDHRSIIFLSCALPFIDKALEIRL